MTHRNVLVGCAALILAFSCQKEEPKKADKEKKEAATAATTAEVNRELAKAVAEVSKQSAQAGQKAAEDGPPPNGLLPPERADREAPRGAAASVKLGSSGSDPKIQLGGSALAGSDPGHLEISVRTGPRSALPTIDFELEAKRVAESAEGDPPAIEWRTKSAKLAQTQLGRIPPEMDKMIQKLKGSSFSGPTKGSALAGPILFQMAKGANPELATALSATADSLSSLTIAYPKEPIGKGAFWMMTSRERYSSTEVVAYRMIRVENIKGNEAELTVETRRYTPETRLGMESLPTHRLLQFEAKDQAKLVAVAGQQLPITGQITQTLLAMIEDQGRPSPVQIQSQVVFSFPPQKAE